MKTRIPALVLIATLALSLAPKPAQAHDKVLAIVGGLLVASAISDNRHDAYDSHYTTVIVRDRNGRCDDRGDNGYWKEVRERTWVPGRWVVERRHHGHEYRRYVEGYYTYRTDRIWVSAGRRGR